MGRGAEGDSRNGNMAPEGLWRVARRWRACATFSTQPSQDPPVDLTPHFVYLHTKVAAGLGANVLEIGHRRAFADITVGDVEIVMHLETRGREHLGEIVAALDALGTSVREYV